MRSTYVDGEILIQEASTDPYYEMCDISTDNMDYPMRVYNDFDSVVALVREIYNVGRETGQREVIESPGYYEVECE